MSSPPPRPSVTVSPRDRDLVRLYWPVELRPAFDALFGIDDAMGDVVARSTQPALGAVKLAWWRERLQELDQGQVPAEPRLKSAASELLPKGVTGEMLAGLEDGWATLLEEEPEAERVGARGALLFGIAASLLGELDSCLDPAGRLFAYEQAGRAGQASLPPPTKELQALARHRFSRRLRPLTAFARLAARDARQAPTTEAEGTPGRALALVVHRLTGRI